MQWLLVGALSLLATSTMWSVQTAGTSSAAQSTLNVLLLIIDDTRWDSIGAAGNKVVLWVANSVLKERAVL